MNIIFMGTPDFAVASLQALHNSKHKITAVVTVPDKPQGRGLKISESPVKKFAAENGLKVLQPVKLKDENFISEIKSMNPDLIIVVAFRILPKELFSAAKFGAVNLHASLLPKYRGAAPIKWAIINGEKETGVTTFFLKEKVDTGNIILQEKCLIDYDDDAGSLHDKLMNIGAVALIKTVDMIDSQKGELKVSQQNDELASPAPKIFKDNCRINWNSNVNSVYNFIRGLSPYPGAFTLYYGRTLKIFKSQITDKNQSFEPGTMTVENERLYINTNSGCLEIKELQLEGKKRMSTPDFLRGNVVQNFHRLT